MAQQRFGWARRVAALAMVSVLVAAGCTRGTDGPEGEETAPAQKSKWTPGMLHIKEDGTPSPGGELTFGGLSEPRSLDPAMNIMSGLTGGMEMAAIFDVLMRWDVESGELVPQLAEGLEHNDDHTEWTLKLREDVKFSNGKPLNAEAVIWSLERYMKMPTDEARMWQGKVASTEAVDERTVKFTLNDPWPTFGYMLTTAPGMIVAEGSDGATPEEFKPIGAGPYVLERHAPGEEIVLTARDDYWRGEVNIKKLRAVFLGAPEATSESFEGGNIKLAALNDPVLADKYIDSDTQMFLNMVPLGRVAIINATEGRPGEDVRVRRAMALAVDPTVIQDRAFGGSGYASDQIFPEISGWHSGVEGYGHDPEEAKKLLEEAKADGFDGKVSYTFPNTPSAREQAMAIKAQLDAVGFETELDPLRGTPELIKKVLIDRDYDLGQSGMSWREAEPWARMAAVGHSTGNPSGTYTSPEMDGLIDEFGREADHDKKVEIAGKIQEQWNQDVPALIFAPAADYVIWSDDVRGIKSHINVMVLFDEAWIEKG
ncbi:ABC transporter substrate-binding protein [Enemella sp. A6]|uniref:ABC transporter substrate-binding protein n=1 Tax=Enemella sp. A6 TaxID=3440152 RepID=UPI003EBC2156